MHTQVCTKYSMTVSGHVVHICAVLQVGLLLGYGKCLAKDHIQFYLCVEPD